jgi:hypothetical protein
LSKARASAAEHTLVLDYERCARLAAPTELRLRVRPQASDDEVRLALARGYWDGLSVKEIVPAPDAVRLGGEEFVYRFAIERGTREAEIIFRVQPQRLGWREGSIAAGSAALTFHQLILP